MHGQVALRALCCTAPCRQATILRWTANADRLAEELGSVAETCGQCNARIVGQLGSLLEAPGPAAADRSGQPPPQASVAEHATQTEQVGFKAPPVPLRAAPPDSAVASPALLTKEMVIATATAQAAAASVPVETPSGTDGDGDSFASAASAPGPVVPQEEAGGSVGDGRRPKSTKIRGTAGMAASDGSGAAPAASAASAASAAPPLETVPTSRAPQSASWLGGGQPSVPPAAPAEKLVVGSEATGRAPVPSLPRPPAVAPSSPPAAVSGGAASSGLARAAGQIPLKSPPLPPPAASAPASSTAVNPWAQFRPSADRARADAGQTLHKPLPMRRPPGIGPVPPDHPPPPDALLGACGQPVRGLSEASAAAVAASLEWQRAVAEDDARIARELDMEERRRAGQLAREQREIGQEGPDGCHLPLGEVGWADRSRCAASEQTRPDPRSAPRWINSYDERSCGYKIHLGDLPPDSHSVQVWQWLENDPRISTATKLAITDIRVSQRASSGASQAFLTFMDERSAREAFRALWDWWTPVPHQIQPRGWRWLAVRFMK